MRRTILSALFVAVLAIWPALSRTQEPIRVTPCELVNAPEKYSGKVVQVRARVNLAFEDFSLAQPGCEEKYPGVWLMYGGDESTPTASTWNDHNRKPGSVVRINGIPVPLVHDANLDLFKRRLAATRLGMIGDTQCYDCYLYDVTATLTGLFFAATDDGKQHAGYGHLGCCHLLVIEAVTDVTYSRTSIPAGARVHCSRESKELTQNDAERLNAICTSCKGLSDSQCSDRQFRQMEATAALWDDRLDFKSGYLDNEGIYEHTEKSAWKTRDRLKYYELSIQSEKPGEDENKVFGGTATRLSCEEVTPPLPQSANLSCREVHKKLHSTPFDSKRESKSTDLGNELTDRPEEMQSLKEQAAAKIDFAAKDLGLLVEPGEKAMLCDVPIVYLGKEIGFCSWNNDSGTVRVGLSLMRTWRPKKSAGHGASPWILTGIGASVCEVEK